MIKNINLGINKTASKQSDIKNKYLKYKQKYLDLKELIGGGGYSSEDMNGVTKRLLVLTDVGEEIDDEGALWMMLKSIGNNNKYAADVVFCTGDYNRRRNRWATILEGQDKYTNITYFYVNQTSRHIRHHHDENLDLLNKVGLNQGNFTEYGIGGENSRWEYDVVLQISPLGDNNSPLGNLSKIKLRDGAETGSYVLVGTESSTNFVKDFPIHNQFKEHLLTNGFLMSIVAQENYANWTLEHTTNMNDVMKTYLYKDEWSKAIGRIPPAGTSTLFIRFRVNCKVNYDVIKNGFNKIKNKNELAGYFTKANDWWNTINDNVYTAIKDGYITKSKTNDDGVFSSSCVSEMIKNQTFTWRDLLSNETINEITNMQEFINLNSDLMECNINDVMSIALLIMTKRMTITYVLITNIYNDRDSTPEELKEIKTGILKYCVNMDFNEFPKLPDLSTPLSIGKKEQVEQITQCFVGNPEYDPSGMFVALALLAASPKTREEISTKLQEKKKLTRDDKRSEYFGKAYNDNLNPKKILDILEQERRELLKKNMELIREQRDASNEEKRKEELKRIGQQELYLVKRQDQENAYFSQMHTLDN